MWCVYYSSEHIIWYVRYKDKCKEISFMINWWRWTLVKTGRQHYKKFMLFWTYKINSWESQRRPRESYIWAASGRIRRISPVARDEVEVQRETKSQRQQWKQLSRLHGVWRCTGGKGRWVENLGTGIGVWTWVPEGFQDGQSHDQQNM